MKVFSVRELTTSLSVLLEREFPFVWVRGQISGLSRPASGHIYFTLKDAEAALNAVWFKSAQRRHEGAADPLTGEVSDISPVDLAASLDNGQEVLCGGGLMVYAQRGQYQLNVQFVQDVGLGRLHLEFEALKRAYAEKGWFAQSRKRPLPWDPARVAVITSPTAAALQDFLRLAQTRGSGSRIRLHPVLVQGEQAPGQIARALARVGEEGWAQVAVLIRGGGSLEDLWAFNTPPVAEAVHDCAVPVLAGVGHEVDVTLADMIADLRAATPSHAAQLLWPERQDLMQGVDALETALRQAFAAHEERAWRTLEHLERGLAWFSPQARLEERRRALEDAAARLAPALGRVVEARDRQWTELDARLRRSGEGALDRAALALEKLHATLELCDPHAPLRRGYALARREGRLVGSVRDLASGDALTLTLADGEVDARVETARLLEHAGSGEQA